MNGLLKSKVMNRIFLDYINAFVSKRTRAMALANVVSEIAINESILDTDSAKFILSSVSTFADGYSRAWFWNRGKYVATALLDFQKGIE